MANNQVDQLSDSSEENKNNFKDQINKASNQDEINKIIEQANELNKQNKATKEKELAEKKNASSSQIDQLTSLTEEEEEEEEETKFKEQINSATSKDNVDSVLQQATKANQKAKDEASKAFSDIKTEANTYITTSLKDAKYADGKAKLEKEIKEADDIVKEANNQNAIKYREAKEKIALSLADAKKHIQKVDKAQLSENQLTVEKFNLEVGKSKEGDWIKNLNLILKANNAKQRFENNANAKLLLINSKTNEVYYDLSFKEDFKGFLWKNPDKIDFATNVVKNKQYSNREITIDKIVIENETEYHNVDLGGKKLTFNFVKTVKTTWAS